MARFYEKVEYKRILAETGLQIASPATRGAWLWTLCHMWNDDVATMTHSCAGWARLWNCSRQAAKSIIQELEREKICDVTTSDSGITLVNRFRERLLKDRASTRERVQRHRGAKCNAPGNGDVTPDVTGVKRGDSYYSNDCDCNSGSERNSSCQQEGGAGGEVGALQHALTYWRMTKRGSVTPKLRSCLSEALAQGAGLEHVRAAMDEARVDIPPWDLSKLVLDKAGVAGVSQYRGNGKGGVPKTDYSKGF